MRILKIATLIFLFSGLISSCQKEYFKKPVLDPNTPISFSNDLQPIMTAKCASSGCHDKSYPPNLLKDKAYLALIDGGYIDTLVPSQSILMTRLNKDMPKGKLPAGDISKFEIWMKQGAKEN